LSEYLTNIAYHVRHFQSIRLELLSSYKPLQSAGDRTSRSRPRLSRFCYTTRLKFLRLVIRHLTSHYITSHTDKRSTNTIRSNKSSPN